MQVFKLSFLSEFRVRKLWFNFCSTLSYLHHQEELNTLITWAKRKRFNGPRRFYEFRLRQIDAALSRIQQNDRALFILCEFLYTAYRQLSPRVYCKGYAAKYSRNYI